MKNCDNHTLDLMWRFVINAEFQYEEDEIEESSLQKKGGVQLVISFNDKKGGKRSTKRIMTN